MKKFSTYGELKFSINNLEMDMQTAVERLELLKPDFEEYITDKSVPLDVRYGYWEEAPACLKNEDCWIPDSDRFNIKGEQLPWFDSPFYYNRQQTVLMFDIVNALEVGKDCELDELNELKEQVLAANLHSFVLDW